MLECLNAGIGSLSPFQRSGIPAFGIPDTYVLSASTGSMRAAFHAG
jgi:hypothetical protein